MIPVSYHVFLLADEDFAFLTTPSPTNGLVDRVDHRSAVVHTGIHTGVVELAVELRDQRPGSIDLSWEEVAETSLAPHSDVRIRSLMDDVPPIYPVLVHGGTGDHRIRVHASGRDTDIDGTAFQPFEHYFIQVWPEQSREDVVFEATDRYGTQLRQFRGERGSPRL